MFKTICTINYKDGYSFRIEKQEDRFIRFDTYANGVKAEHGDPARAPYSSLPCTYPALIVDAITLKFFNKLAKYCFDESWHQRPPVSSETLMHNGYQG